MATVDVVMPQMGESIAEGTIVRWHKKVGERVQKDETLLEISTDKVDSEIPSPASGVLAKIIVEEQKTVPVQTVIALIETEGAVAASIPSVAASQAPALPVERTPPPAGEIPRGEAVRPVGGRFYSPLVLSIARTEGIGMVDLEGIPGSGEGGRLTKKDLLLYLEMKKKGGPPAPKAVPGIAIGTPSDSAELRKKYPAPAYDVLKMSNVLQRMAHHMVQSVQTSPHVAAVHEVDMTRVVKHRAEQATAFEQREGFKLTFTPYIVDAVVRALKKFPLVNSSVEGDAIIRKNFINVGMAVASESGLLVPVIHHAEGMNFLGLARAVQDIATRTRAKKLTPDDITGGTFTISNYGVFGTTFGIPIINQPQVAILGTGAIAKRPVVTEEDAIAIRSIAYFTLSFDHRIIDGALGGMFLEEIVQNLERFDATTAF
jgi:2-oxoglutarate dehydrogenase E2 component (dihydrolipoamide succinyltransferase)